MSKAPFAIIAVIVASILFINVIRLIALILLIGTVTMIVVTLIIWALSERHYRKTERREQASALARAQSAASSGHTPAIQDAFARFAEIALLRRVLSKTEERIARQFADAVAEGQDLATINDLISKVLRGKDT